MNGTPDEPANRPVTLTLRAKENDAGRRLDRILRKHFPAFPLSFINRLLRERKVRVNGKPRNGAYRVVPEDTITVAYMNVSGPIPAAPPPRSVSDQRLSAPPDPVLRIVYEDDDLLVADKPTGLLTHGLLTHGLLTHGGLTHGGLTRGGLTRGGKDGEDSLASRVSAYLADKIPASLSFRPGPLHRLDRNTSGLVVFGKSLKGARSFTHATRHGLVKKHYLALASGIIEKEEVWEDYLVRNKKERKTRAAHTPNASEGAKKAVTRIRPLESKTGATLIEAEISSGKTHQIRAQCALHGHPLCGDKKYGGPPRHGGYLLRACRIVIERDGETLTIDNRQAGTGCRSVPE